MLRGIMSQSRVLCVAFLLVIAPCQSSSINHSDTSRVERQAKKAEAAGDIDGALSLYVEGLNANPSWTDGWWEYGALLYESHRFAEAAQAFGRLTRLAPDNPMGFALLGLCEYEQSDWSNARLHLTKALATSPRMPPDISRATAFHLGLMMLHEGEADPALVVFENLYHQAPDYPGLSTALGTAELRLEAVPETTSPLFPAVELANQAAIAVTEDRKNDAGNAYRALLLQFPSQPFVHLRYGILLVKQNRNDEAAKEFRAETTLNSHSAEPWIWLARIALEKNDATEARDDAARARTLDPVDGLSYYIEGRSFMLLHQWDNALGSLLEAEKRAPENAEVHFSLVSVYVAMQRADDAAQERQLFLQASKAADAQKD
jgi:tetratricopeptide (TPR) repeat protein